MNEQVGLVGFGIMGAAIATRLIDAGNSVTVYDASAAAMRRARDIGCSTAATPHQIARRARVTIISLPRPEHVVEVVRGSDQCLLAGASEGSVIVDTSTVDPATSQQNAEAALREGVGYLDCPVLGRPANVGSWTLPTGGDARCWSSRSENTKPRATLPRGPTTTPVCSLRADRRAGAADDPGQVVAGLPASLAYLSACFTCSVRSA